MLLMFERGIRGGITQSIHRYARACNNYIGEHKESSFLQYLDANNLYGWVMIQPLSTGGFERVSGVSKFTSEKACESVVARAIC